MDKVTVRSYRSFFSSGTHTGDFHFELATRCNKSLFFSYNLAIRERGRAWSPFMGKRMAGTKVFVARQGYVINDDVADEK